MCLGIPGQIVAWVDPANAIAKVDVDGVRRNVNAALLVGEDAVDVGDWVLIHVGFAMSKVDEAEALATKEFLESLGGEWEEELEGLKGSAIE